jgi:beta-xylosidase
VNFTGPVDLLQTSDEFSGSTLSLQWQWQANYSRSWFSNTARPGWLRLYPQKLSGVEVNLWNVPNLILQKLPAETFVLTSKFDVHNMNLADKTGLVIMGTDYAYIGICKSDSGYNIEYVFNWQADKGHGETLVNKAWVRSPEIYLRVEVMDKAMAKYSYSNDGCIFKPIGDTFAIKPGRWIGAKAGVFLLTQNAVSFNSWVDIDWFRFDFQDH